MQPPFTPEEFFEVFHRYNEAVWPIQPALLFLALLAIALVHMRARRVRQAASWILAGLWLWMAVVYHFWHLATINSAAWVFGTLFLVQGTLFVWYGGVVRSLNFKPTTGPSAAAGWTLIVYSMLVYPLIGFAVGHGYFASPTFGVPCPTTIFTVGILHFTDLQFPRFILAIPLAWSAVGSFAAAFLAVPQDLGLSVAGIALLVMLARMRPGSHGRDKSHA